MSAGRWCVFGIVGFSILVAAQCARAQIGNLGWTKDAAERRTREIDPTKRHLRLFFEPGFGRSSQKLDGTSFDGGEHYVEAKFGAAASVFRFSNLGPLRDLSLYGTLGGSITDFDEDAIRVLAAFGPELGLRLIERPGFMMRPFISIAPGISYDPGITYYGDDRTKFVSVFRAGIDLGDPGAIAVAIGAEYIKRGKYEGYFGTVREADLLGFLSVRLGLAL